MTGQSKAASKVGSNEHKESSDGSAAKDWHRGFDYTDPRLNTKYGDPSKLSLSPTNSTPRVSYEQDRADLRMDIMRWQLHRSAQGSGKSSHALKSRFKELDEARFAAAHHAHIEVGDPHKIARK